MTSNQKRVAVAGLIIILIIVAVAITTNLASYLRSQVAPGDQSTTLTKQFTWTPNQNIVPGNYSLSFMSTDSQGANSTKTVAVSVVAEDNGTNNNSGGNSGGSSDGGEDNGGGGGDGGGGGGGGDGNSGGGGGGGDSEPPLAKPVRTYINQSEQGHQISGSHSGVVTDGSQTVVTLAHAKAALSKNMSVPADDYWLDIRAKHDRPGPVKLAIYINNKAWKVISLDKNDNRYRIHRVGLLRNFSRGNIRFRFLNDVYDKNNPTNADTDRNLHIDWWRLTTGIGSSVTASVPGTGGPSATATKKSGRSKGWSLLPRLNSFIRSNLGPQHVTFNIWSYYARRLTISPSDRSSIQNQSQLESKMHYWRTVSPNRPRGD